MKLPLVSSRTCARKLHELGKLARFQGPSTDGFSASLSSSGSMSLHAGTERMGMTREPSRSTAGPSFLCLETAQEAKGAGGS